jgi:F-box and WD-40 domain protein CDC4
MDHTIRVWDLLSGAIKHVLSRHESLVGLLSLSPSFLVSGAAEGLVCVWDPASSGPVQTLEHKSGAVTAIQHDDTKVISGTGDGLMRVLDLKSGEVRDLLSDKRAGVVCCVAFTGHLCVAVTQMEADTTVDVWNFGEERVESLTDASSPTV